MYYYLYFVLFNHRLNIYKDAILNMIAWWRKHWECRWLRSVLSLVYCSGSSCEFLKLPCYLHELHKHSPPRHMAISQPWWMVHIPNWEGKTHFAIPVTTDVGTESTWEICEGEGKEEKEEEYGREESGHRLEWSLQWLKGEMKGNNEVISLCITYWISLPLSPPLTLFFFIRHGWSSLIPLNGKSQWK